MLFKREVKINLGCGQDIRRGWKNFDLFPVNDRVSKLDLRDSDEVRRLSRFNPDVVELNHVIGYFHLCEGRNLLEAIFTILRPGGKLIIEYPDVKKISALILNAQDEPEFFEAMRALYAFDIADLYNAQFSKKTYVFGWSEDVLLRLLRDIGFTKVISLDPETHGRRSHRDTRIEAFL